MDKVEERARFDAWAKGAFGEFYNTKCPLAEQMWSAWQAALREQAGARGVVDDAMVDAYLAAQAKAVQAVDDKWGGGGKAASYLHPVREACRAGLTAALTAAQPQLEGGGEVELALEYLRPHLEAGTFAAPDWAIQLASILTGGDGCGKSAPPSAPVGPMTDDSRVPDDYRNQASGYRAGWNDALASALAQQPARQEPKP